MSEGPKLIPIGNPVTVTRRTIGLGTHITSFCFAFEPLVYGRSADIEVLAGFTFEHSIQLNGIHHFLSQVVTIAAGHFSFVRILLQTTSILVWLPLYLQIQSQDK